jgi:hypothetical protein
MSTGIPGQIRHASRRRLAGRGHHPERATRHVDRQELGRDYGATVEILRGVEPEDLVITSPPDGLSESSVVRIAPAPAAGKKA